MLWEDAWVQTADDFELHAWVDESMRTTGNDEQMYLLGAVVADPSCCDGARDALRRALPKGAPKLHWHVMEPREKTRATTVDMKLVRHLRGKKSIPSTLRVDIAQPSTEPMLWVPDQVLGALGDAEADEGRWFDQYGGAVERITISL